MAALKLTVNADANLAHLTAAQQSANTPEASLERLEAVAEILRTLDGGTDREGLVRVLRRRLYGERVAGYLDGDADGRRERVEATLQAVDWDAAIRVALAEVAA